jgi:hypothetical protein
MDAVLEERQARMARSAHPGRVLKGGNVVFGMGHQPEHIARRVADARQVEERTIGVMGINTVGRAAIRADVGQGYLVGGF